MPVLLDAPEIQTQTVTTIVITRIVNDIENQMFTIEYIRLLEEGTPQTRDSYNVRGTLNIQTLYAELDTILATGKTFEEASKELLYSKIAVGTLT